VWPRPQDLLDVKAVEAHRPKVVVALTGYVADRHNPRRRNTAAGSVEFMEMMCEPTAYRVVRQMTLTGKDDALSCRGDEASADEDDVNYQLTLLVRADHEVSPEMLDRIPQGTLVLPPRAVSICSERY